MYDQPSARSGLNRADTAKVFGCWYAGHDRVIILTDEQSASDDPGKRVPLLEAGRDGAWPWQK